MAVNREDIDRAIDDLPPDSLEELQVFIRYLHHKRTHPGSAWLRTLYDVFEPVRQNAIESDMTEDEINQLIDDAINEVRRERDT